MWFGEGYEAIRQVSTQEMSGMNFAKRLGMFPVIKGKPETHYLDLQIDHLCEGLAIRRFQVSYSIQSDYARLSV